MTLEGAIAFYSGVEGRHKSYPVVDAHRRVLGMISRSDILAWARDPETQTGTLADALAGEPLLHGFEDETVAALADRMVAADASRAPILSRADGRLVGLVARRDLLKVRARLFQHEQLRSQGFA
jgi:CBS domain-containing protein